MASPIGHSLAGLALGIALTPPGRGRILPLTAAVVASNVPDLDLLPSLAVGFERAGHLHHGHTHTLGFALILGILALALPAGRRHLGAARWGLLVFLAVAGHVAVDFLTSDTRPPIGVMVFWPFSDQYLIAPRTLFHGIDKRSLEALFGAANLRAGLLEALVLGPLALIAGLGRGWIGPPLRAVTGAEP